MSSAAKGIVAAAFVSLALVATAMTTTYRLRYLERVNAIGAGSAEAAALGVRVHRILPAPYVDGTMWITEARHLAAAGHARLHWTNSDNAPFGRPVHWSSLYFWWLLALGAVRGIATGSPLAVTVEDAAPYAGPVLLALVLPLLAWMAARRSGAAGAAVVALSLAGAFPLAECFYAGNVDHHGLIAASVMAAGLALAAAGGGWVVAGGEARARRWIIASGIAAAVGLWVSAVSLMVVVAGIGLGAAASAPFLRTPRGPEPAALAPWPEGWRLWGWAGGLASLAFYLVEYFPAEMGMRLEVDHPLYALAFVGGGELLCAWWRWMRDGTLARRDGARAALAAIAVLALPAAVVAGGPAWYALRDPFLWRLHQDIEEFRSLHDLIIRSPGDVLPALSPLPLVLVAGVLLAADRSRPPATRSLVLLALGPALVLSAVALWQTRWIGLWLATLAVLGSTAIGTLGRIGVRHNGPASSWQSTIWVTLLVPLVIQLYGTFDMVTSAQAQAESRAFVPDDIVTALLRDMAIVIDKDPAAPWRPIVLASPDATVALAYFADLRGLGTFYWENAPGLRAAVQMFAATTAEEARALLRARQVTHVLLLSERGFIGTSYKLVHGRLDQEAARNTFFGRILYAGEAPPAWLRPLPYTLPIARLGDRPLLAVILEVVR